MSQCFVLILSYLIFVVTAPASLDSNRKLYRTMLPHQSGPINLILRLTSLSSVFAVIASILTATLKAVRSCCQHE
jgi:hypothetical protein